MSLSKGSSKAILEMVDSTDFLQEINNLLEPRKAVITMYDNWMPKCETHPNEAELKDFLKYNFNPQLSKGIANWWLEFDGTTPNWDLLSTCTINGVRGLLLVEAKAHCSELHEAGKSLAKDASDNSVRNDKKIGQAIEMARIEIERKHPGIQISKDKCYQLSNRVAHAWWLSNHGIPVVLMYLGFLNRKDMDDGINEIFKDENEWENCFHKHTTKVGIDKIVDKWVDCGESKFILISRSI